MQLITELNTCQYVLKLPSSAPFRESCCDKGTQQAHSTVIQYGIKYSFVEKFFSPGIPTCNVGNYKSPKDMLTYMRLHIQQANFVFS